MDRWTDRYTDKKMDRHTIRQTVIQMARKTDGWIDKQTDGLTDRPTHKLIFMNETIEKNLQTKQEKRFFSSYNILG